MTFWTEFAYHGIRTVMLFTVILAGCRCVLGPLADRELERINGQL